MTREQLLALVAAKRHAFYGGNLSFTAWGPGRVPLPHSTPHDAGPVTPAAAVDVPGSTAAHSFTLPAWRRKQSS